jgi:hypothetical protein
MMVMHQLAIVALAWALPCLATPPPAQHPLQEKPSANWTDCGSLNGHTLECKQLELYGDNAPRVAV